MSETVNIVEVLASEGDCAFDQPCKFGHRVEDHAVYCHNEAWYDHPRKCHRSWYTGGERKDEDCPGFSLNPAYAGPLSPSALTGAPCGACNGLKLKQTENGRSETCRRCMGSGSEPILIPLSAEAIDVLERGLQHSGKHPGFYEPFIVVARNEKEKSAVYILDGAQLIHIRSMTFSSDIVFLAELTQKGEAVLLLAWAARSQKS